MRLVQRFAFEVKKRLIERPDERDSNIAIEHMVSSFVSPPSQPNRCAQPILNRHALTSIFKAVYIA